MAILLSDLLHTHYDPSKEVIVTDEIRPWRSQLDWFPCESNRPFHSLTDPHKDELRASGEVIATAFLCRIRSESDSRSRLPVTQQMIEAET